jgi:hypothetical protein
MKILLFEIVNKTMPSLGILRGRTEESICEIKHTLHYSTPAHIHYIFVMRKMRVYF